MESNNSVGKEAILKAIWDYESDPARYSLAEQVIFPTMTEYSSLMNGQWQLCPKCHGDGHLGRYNSPNLSTTATPLCDVCHGAKIIAPPSLMNKEKDEKIEELAEKRLAALMEKEPSKCMMWMMIQMGKMCIETNAASLDLKQESTLDEVRYEIKAKITVRKIKTQKS